MRKRGFTMMEMVLYIAIGLALLASGFYAYQQAKASSEMAGNTSRVIQIATETRILYRSAGTMSGLTMADVMSRSSLPPSAFNNISMGSTGPRSFNILMQVPSIRSCNRMRQAEVGADNVQAFCNSTVRFVMFDFNG